MRISRKLAVLGAFLVVAAGAVAGCGSSSSVGGATVASVAGNQISLRAYKHWMYVAAKGNAEEQAGTPVIVASDPPRFRSCIHQIRAQVPQLAKTSAARLKSDCRQLFTELNGEDVMPFLIEAYWYQADAYKLGIRMTAKQVAAAFAKAKKQEFPTKKDYASFLAQSGQTDADIRYRVLVNTLYSKLLKRYEKKVTPAAVRAYYERHSSEFGTAQTRDIRLVRTRTEAAAQTALAALKSGQSWAAVARRYSIDPSSKDNGGLISGIQKGQEEHALDAVAFSSPVGRLEGPVHGTTGWYVVEVAKITPATHESLTQATPVVKEELTQSNVQAAEAKITAISKRNWGRQTTCAKLYAIATYCHNYAAPKAAATTPAARSSATTTPTTTTPATTSSASTSGATPAATATTT